METVIPALIVITLLLLAAFMISEQALSAQESVATSWLEMQERVEERARTDISPVGTATSYDGSTVEVTLRNDGDTKLADFEQWDVIVQYDSTGNGDYDVVEWLSYPEGAEVGSEPLDDEWRVSEILLDAFDPDILNPEEEMVIKLRVSPPITPTGRAIITTPNGVTASTIFARE